MCVNKYIMYDMIIKMDVVVKIVTKNDNNNIGFIKLNFCNSSL